jgi:hypothetical protein
MGDGFLGKRKYDIPLQGRLNMISMCKKRKEFSFFWE